MASRLHKFLFGRDTPRLSSVTGRGQSLSFPDIHSGEVKRINWRTDDGLILEMLNMIWKLQDEIEDLKKKK